MSAAEAERGRQEGRPLQRAVVLRALLGTLAAVSGALGAYATAAPHGFYRHVVGVDLLGPFNGHLLADIGGFYLGFALLFAWAARTLAVELVRAASAGWLVTQLLHNGYHLAHLHRFTTGDAIEQTLGLASLVALPAAALLLSRSGAKPLS